MSISRLQWFVPKYQTVCPGLSVWSVLACLWHFNFTTYEVLQGMFLFRKVHADCSSYSLYYRLKSLLTKLGNVYYRYGILITIWRFVDRIINRLSTLAGCIQYSPQLIRLYTTHETINTYNSLSKTWYWLGVCHAWFQSYSLSWIVQHANNAKIKKWKILIHSGLEPTVSHLLVWRSNRFRHGTTWTVNLYRYLQEFFIL